MLQVGLEGPSSRTENVPDFGDPLDKQSEPGPKEDLEPRSTSRE